MSIKREVLPESNKKLSEIRLIALGDCNTSGTGHSSVPAQLQQLLNDEGSLCRLENVGEAMRTSREGVTLSKSLPEPFDIALINYGLVDAWITTIPKVYISYHPDNVFKRPFRKALKSIKKRLRSPCLRDFFTPGPVVSCLEYTQNIDKIISVLHEKNPRILLIFWGSVPVQDEPRNSNLHLYDRALEACATKYHGFYIDTRKLLSKDKRQTAFDDDVHLSIAAQVLIAEAMSIKLKASIKS